MKGNERQMESEQHYFFAVKIPDETKLRMKENCQYLQETFPFKRWVHYMDFHITLAFLGFAPQEKLNQAIKNVKNEMIGTKAFKLQIHKLGIFGKIESPRVFWADTMESFELKLVRGKVFTACQNSEFQLEKRAFRPHITLARKWEGGKPFSEEELAIWKKIQPEPLEFKATNVVLYKTNLLQTPKYEAIETFSLD